MFDSHSDCSDDDPDFSVERKKQGKTGWLSQQGASSSEEEIYDPDAETSRRKKPRKVGTPKTPNAPPPKDPRAGRRSVGRPRKSSTVPPSEMSTPRRPHGGPRKYSATTPGTTNGAGYHNWMDGQPSAGHSSGSPPLGTFGQPSSGAPPAQVVPLAAAVTGSSPVPINSQDKVPVIVPTVSIRQTPGEHDYYCCVRNCMSRDITNRDGLWLFALPDDPELLRIWNERLPIDHERNRPRSPRVCFRHFEKDDYVRRQQRLTGLRQGALPVKETGGRT